MSDFIERAKFSCALGGALSTVAAISKAVPIVHAAGGCAALLSNTYNLAAGYRGAGYCGGNMIPTSNISPHHIVFGGDDRLQEQIEHTIRIMDGDLYFVLTGCQVEIIGDDAIHVAQGVQKDTQAPILAANTPGFLGSSHKGYDAVLKTIVTNLVKPVKKKSPNTINILGIIPGQDVFYRGNIREIQRLLAQLGIRANTFFAPGETIDKIKKYGNAALTIVFSDTYGIETAQTFEEVHSIPYVTSELPIGPTRTEAFVRQLAEQLHLASELVEDVLAQEKKNYYSYIESIVDIYSDIDLQRYAIIAADSSYAYSLTSFLAEDLGWIPHLVVINDLFEEEQQVNYAKKFATLTSETKPKVVFEPHAGQLSKHISNSWPDNHNDKYFNTLNPAFLVGSSIDAAAAQKIGAGFLSVVFPLTNRVVMNKGYAGFNGSISLAEDLFSVLLSNR